MSDTAQGTGIKSLEAALLVLDYLAKQNGPKSLSDIARDCAIAPSKAHRYLKSFVNAGLVTQAGRSGLYDLGHGALKLGLAGLARHDFVNHAADGLTELSARTGMTVLLSVWSGSGATIVRWERGPAPTNTSIGLGSTLPLLNTATGHIYLAWGQQAALAATRDAELADTSMTATELDAVIQTTRNTGYSAVDSRYIPGLMAIAAPILDWQSEAQAVVTLVGTDPSAILPNAPEISALLEFCKAETLQGA